MIHTLILTIFMLGQPGFITEIPFSTKQDCEKAKVVASLQVLPELREFVTGVSAECKQTPQT